MRLRWKGSACLATVGGVGLLLLAATFLDPCPAGGQPRFQNWEMLEGDDPGQYLQAVPLFPEGPPGHLIASAALVIPGAAARAVRSRGKEQSGP